jgi:LysM repeat protein
MPGVVPVGQVYTVRPGDTLFNIAAMHGTTVEALQVANQLFDYYAIYVGQPLVIPESITWASEPMILPPTPPDNPNLRVGDWPNPYPPAPLFQQSFPPGRVTGFREKWIDVDLTRQALTAYEDQTPVFNSRVSSGIWQYPTIVGTFQIYVKYEVADMSGGSGEDTYYLPNVPYVMYFHGNYGLHGTYWHNNFGTPMSHGCVNLPTPAAEWLFHWAPLGTKVVTHY